MDRVPIRTFIRTFCPDRSEPDEPGQEDGRCGRSALATFLTTKCRERRREFLAYHAKYPAKMAESHDHSLSPTAVPAIYPAKYPAISAGYRYPDKNPDIMS